MNKYIIQSDNNFKGYVVHVPSLNDGECGHDFLEIFDSLIPFTRFKSLLFHLIFNEGSLCQIPH